MHMLVAVPVMQIGIVRMPMHQRLMAMPVHMRLTERHVWPMYVPMMRVVAVAVLVLYRFVRMLMVVPLGEMQP